MITAQRRFLQRTDAGIPFGGRASEDRSRRAAAKAGTLILYSRLISRYFDACRERIVMSSLLRDPAQLQRATGWNRDVATCPTERGHLRSYIAFQMASAGLSPPDEETSADSMAAFSAGILDSLKEKNRLLSEHRAPIDSRIEAFLNEHLSSEVGDKPLRLPSPSLTLDRHGMARELSLPVNGYSFQNDLVQSYR